MYDRRSYALFYNGRTLSLFVELYNNNIFNEFSPAGYEKYEDSEQKHEWWSKLQIIQGVDKRCRFGTIATRNIRVWRGL